MDRRNRSLKAIALVAAACIVQLGSCTSDENKPSSGLAVSPVYDSSLTPEEAAMAKKAFTIFCEKCQPLMGKYAADIELIEISRGMCVTNERELGWDKQFEIKIKIKDRPEIVPFKTYAWGHYEYYSIGGPVNPGFTTSKHPVLCGVEDGEDHSLISVPSLSFIK